MYFLSMFQSFPPGQGQDEQPIHPYIHHVRHIVSYLQLRLAGLGSPGLLIQPVEDRAVLLYDLGALELEPVLLR
jgi:hypothetical protein